MRVVKVQFSFQMYRILNEMKMAGGEARLLMDRVGVRVDILPALCHRRDVGWRKDEGRIRESTVGRWAK